MTDQHEDSAENLPRWALNDDRRKAIANLLGIEPDDPAISEIELARQSYSVFSLEVRIKTPDGTRRLKASDQLNRNPFNDAADQLEELVNSGRSFENAIKKLRAQAKTEMLRVSGQRTDYERIASDARKLTAVASLALLVAEGKRQPAKRGRKSNIAVKIFMQNLDRIFGDLKGKHRPYTIDGSGDEPYGLFVDFLRECSPGLSGLPKGNDAILKAWKRKDK